MPATVRLTSKRQATFSAELCEDLGLSPGDELELIPRVEGGRRFWILQKRKSPPRPWFGCLSDYAGQVSGHSMEAIRESIARGKKA